MTKKDYKIITLLIGLIILLLSVLVSGFILNITNLSSGVFNNTFYNTTINATQLNKTLAVNGTYTGIVQNFTSIAGSEGDIINITTDTTLPEGTNITIKLRTSNLSLKPLFWLGFDDSDLSVHNYIPFDTWSAVLDASITSDGYFENGLYVPDTNSYIKTDNSYTGTIDEFLLCFWLNKRGPTVGAIMSINSDDVRINMDNNLGIEFVFNGDGTDCSIFDFQTDNINYGEWNHFCVGKNATRCHVYMNGVFDAGEASTGIYSANAPIFIGNKNNLIMDLNGTLDDIIFFNYSLNPSQILALFEGEHNWTSYSDPCDVSINTTGCLFDRAGNFTQPKFTFLTDDVTLTPILYNYTYTIQESITLSKPTQITNLINLSRTSSSIYINYTNSTQHNSNTLYRLNLDSVFNTTITQPYNITGLNQNTEYYITVFSNNASGTNSTITPGNNLTVTTLTSTAPTTPTTIECNGGTCNNTFTTNIIMNCSGSTDPESDTITYIIEKGIAISNKTDYFNDASIDSKWTIISIGTTGESYEEAHRELNLYSEGADIEAAGDAFQFTYQNISGDFVAQLNVTGLDNTNEWAKAGLMVRNSIITNSANAMGLVTPTNGVRIQWRATTGAGTSSTGISSHTVPVLIQVNRTGAVVASRASDDNGGTWSNWYGSASLTFTGDVLLGIAHTSHEDGTYGWSNFSDFQLLEFNETSNNDTTTGYTIIGNHTETTTYSWDISGETFGQTYNQLRCYAIDLDGSNTYSSNYTESSNITLEYVVIAPNQVTSLTNLSQTTSSIYINYTNSSEHNANTIYLLMLDAVNTVNITQPYNITGLTASTEYNITIYSNNVSGTNTTILAGNSILVTTSTKTSFNMSSDLNSYLWDYISFDDVVTGDDVVEGLNSRLIFKDYGWDYISINTSGVNGSCLQSNATTALSGINGLALDDDVAGDEDDINRILDFFNNNQNWGICWWAKTLAGGGEHIFSIWGHLGMQYHNLDNGNWSGIMANIQDGLSNTEYSWNNGVFIIPNNTWHFSCLGYGDDSFDVPTFFQVQYFTGYENGVMLSNNTIENHPLETIALTEIGLMTSGVQYVGYYGLMDEFYIVNTSSTEVFKSIYNGTFYGGAEGIGIAPTISGITISDIGSIGFQIDWNTDVYSNTTVLFKRVADPTWNVSEINDSGKVHNRIITNLDPLTNYNVTVRSCTPNGLCSNSSAGNVTTTQYQFDVLNITYGWVRWYDAVGGNTNITAYVQADNNGTSEVNVTFKVNGTIVCSNVSTFTNDTPKSIVCDYTTNNNVAIILVESNYSSSDSKRLLGLWKENPYYFNINWTEQYTLLNTSTGSIRTNFDYYLDTYCVGQESYTASSGGTSNGYWRGNIIFDHGLCYLLRKLDGDTTQEHMDNFFTDADYWCDYNEITWLAMSVHDSVALQGRLAEAYDLLASDMNQSKRDQYVNCFYNISTWEQSRTARAIFSPGNGQGIETGRSEPPVIIYGSNNSFGDTFLQENDMYHHFVDSSYNFLMGYRGGVYAPDGINYRTYGMYSGYLGAVISHFDYPNGQFVDAIQNTICEWNMHEIYSVIKMSDSYTRDGGTGYVRHIDEKDTNAYQARSITEGMWSVAYCQNETLQQLALWAYDFIWNSSNQNKYSVHNARHWLPFYRNITPLTPKQINLPTTYIENTGNGTLPALVYWRSGWDTLDDGVPEDTVIQFLSDDTGTTGHNNADDNSIYIYVGSSEGGNELFTDGGGRRAEYLGTTYLGVGQDFKAAEVRHNVLFIDDKEGGAWGDMGEITPSIGYQLLEYSQSTSGNNVSYNNCWFGDFDDGGLRDGYTDIFPYCAYYPANISGRISEINEDVNNSLTVQMNKFYYGGIAGHYLNWTREVLIYNNSERMFLLIYDSVNNPTSNTHNYSINWLTATNNSLTEGDIVSEAGGYTITNGLAKGFFKVVYSDTSYTYDMNEETVNKGEYQGADSYYERITENHVDYAEDENLSTITLIVPYTASQSNPLSFYSSEVDGDSIRVRLLGENRTYDVNFSKDHSFVVTYTAYDTVVPFVVLNSPVTDFWYNTSTVNLTCNISSNNNNISNITLFLDDIANETIDVVGKSYQHNFIVNNLSEGTHNWTCQGYDNESVVSNKPAVLIINVDTVAPVVTISTMPIDDIRPLLNISVSETVVNISYSENDIDYTLLCETCNNDVSTYFYYGEGEHTVYVKTYDNADNLGNSSQTWTLNLSNSFTDTFTNSLYVETHNFTAIEDNFLQFYKLNMTEYIMYKPEPVSYPNVWCAVVDSVNYDLYTEGTSDSTAWINDTDVSVESSYQSCNSTFLRYNATSQTSIGSSGVVGNYSHFTHYVQVPISGEYAPYSSITYRNGLDHSSYQWAHWWVIDDVVANQYHHGEDSFRLWRNENPTMTNISSKRTVAMDVYPMKTYSVIDRLMYCTGLTVGIFTQGTCYPLSNKTTDRNASGEYYGKQINLSNDLNWTTVNWSLSNGTIDDFTVEINVNGTWYSYTNNQVRYFNITPNETTIQYRVLFNSEVTVNIDNLTITWGIGEAPTSPSTPPQVTGLTNLSRTTSSIYINYTNSSEHNANTKYLLMLNSVNTANITQPYDITGLSASTQYNITIYSNNASGTNTSISANNSILVTTSAATTSTSSGGGSYDPYAEVDEEELWTNVSTYLAPYFNPLNPEHIEVVYPNDWGLGYFVESFLYVYNQDGNTYFPPSIQFESIPDGIVVDTVKEGVNFTTVIFFVSEYTVLGNHSLLIKVIDSATLEQNISFIVVTEPSVGNIEIDEYHQDESKKDNFVVIIVGLMFLYLFIIKKVRL